MKKINCRKNDSIKYCQDRRIKRSLINLGSRLCLVYQGKHCPYQDKYTCEVSPDNTTINLTQYCQEKKEGTICYSEIDRAELFSLLDEAIDKLDRYDALLGQLKNTLEKHYKLEQ